MKTLTILAVLLITQQAHGAINPCDQRVYDQIYKNIILETLRSDLTTKDFAIRNNTIEKLRELCRGQKSTWEEPTIILKAGEVIAYEPSH